MVSLQYQPISSNKYRECGITDETAIEGHDLTHNAEVDEKRVRSLTPTTPKFQKNLSVHQVD